MYDAKTLCDAMAKGLLERPESLIGIKSLSLPQVTGEAGLFTFTLDTDQRFLVTVVPVKPENKEGAKVILTPP